MLLSQESFNFLFTEKHQLVSPLLEVELIGEKVSVERVQSVEKWSPRKKVWGKTGSVGRTPGPQGPQGSCPRTPINGQWDPTGPGPQCPGPPVEKTPRENQRYRCRWVRETTACTWPLLTLSPVPLASVSGPESSGQKSCRHSMNFCKQSSVFQSLLMGIMCKKRSYVQIWEMLGFKLNKFSSKFINHSSRHILPVRRSHWIRPIRKGSRVRVHPSKGGAPKDWCPCLRPPHQARFVASSCWDGHGWEMPHTSKILFLCFSEHVLKSLTSSTNPWFPQHDCLE